MMIIIRNDTTIIEHTAAVHMYEKILLGKGRLKENYRTCNALKSSNKI